MRVVDDMQSVLGRVEQLDGGSADVERLTAWFAAPCGQRDIDALIGANAATYSIDPALVRSIVEAESGFNPRATSPAGARGLMQLMPETAQSLGVVDAYDPAENLRGGTRYLRGLLDRFGDVRLAVAAYNAGPAAVERFRRRASLFRDAGVRASRSHSLSRAERRRRGAVLKPAKLR